MLLSILNEGEQRYLPREIINNDYANTTFSGASQVILNANGIDATKCDVFSLGMTVYELMLGRALSLDNDNQEW